MYDAELYQNSNTLQKRDALQCLQEYTKKIKWRNFDKVIDIGCGDGGVTKNILEKFIPSNYTRLVGIDICEKMVQFANEHYSDERTAFTILDIEGNLNEDLRASFDHAFSFYTIHWIIDQERAFANIYDILSEGGDCLLMFLGHMPLFDVFRILSRRTKWQPWLKNVNRFVSPYHDSQEPEKDVRRLMAKTGFTNIHVECKEMLFVYNKVEILKKAVSAVNPFKIPENLQEDFFEDYLQIVRDMRLIDEVNNNINEPFNVRTSYTLIYAYGSK